MVNPGQRLLTDDGSVLQTKLPLRPLFQPEMVTRLLRLQHTTVSHSCYIVRIPNANVHRFGDPDGARPVLRAVDWTVREGESWAVVGSGAGEKTALLEVSRERF
jgi:ABC-type molybdenum transport system ATPase subunit/photorepair protein PhrA